MGGMGREFWALKPYLDVSFFCRHFVLLLPVALFSSFQVMGKDRSVVTDQDRQFWSFQPFQKNAAPLASDRWVQSPIDVFY